MVFHFGEDHLDAGNLVLDVITRREFARSAQAVKKVGQLLVRGRIFRRASQAVELDLKPFRGRVPVEMMGQSAFPPIGELPYMLTLPAHGFYWFRLARDAEVPPWHEEHLVREDLPLMVLFGGWSSVFPDRIAPWRASLAQKTRERFECEILPRYVAQQRWFASRAEALARIALRDWAVLESPGRSWLLATVEARFAPAAAGEPAPDPVCKPADPRPQYDRGDAEHEEHEPDQRGIAAEVEHQQRQDGLKREVLAEREEGEQADPDERHRVEAGTGLVGDGCDRTSVLDRAHAGRFRPARAAAISMSRLVVTGTPRSSRSHSFRHSVSDTSGR